MSELKPCPFCGSGYIDTGCLTVGCCRCGANGPEGYEGVTETWNDRPIEDALRAEVAALKRNIDGFSHMLTAANEDNDRLKAKLAKYTEPLTDEQAEQAFDIAKADGVGECDTLALGMQGIDAAIRRVRRGE